MQLFNLVAIGPANLISGGVIDAAGFSLSSALFATVNGAAATKPTGVDFDNLLAAFQQPSAPKSSASPLASLPAAPTSNATKNAAAAAPTPVSSVSMNAAVDTASFNDAPESDEPLQRLLVSQSKASVVKVPPQPTVASELKETEVATDTATEASVSVTVNGVAAETNCADTETSDVADSDSAETTAAPHKPAGTRSKQKSVTPGPELSNSGAVIAPDAPLSIAESNDVAAEVHHAPTDETEAADIPFTAFTNVSQSESGWPQAMTLTATPVSQQVESCDSSATGTSLISETASPGNQPTPGPVQQTSSRPQQPVSLPPMSDNTEPAPRSTASQLDDSPTTPTSASDVATVPAPVVDPQSAAVVNTVPTAASTVTAALPQQTAVTAQVASVTPPPARPLQVRVNTPITERKAAASINPMRVEPSPLQSVETPIQSPVEVISNLIETATLPTTEVRPDETRTSAPTTSSDAPVANPNSSQPIDAGILSATTSTPLNVTTPVNSSPQPTTLHHGTVEHLASVTVQQATLVEAGGSQRFQIRLDPPHLGEVVIDISRGSDGQYDISVSAASPETHALLEQQSADITQALTDQGMSLNGFDLSQHQQGSTEEHLLQQEQAELARLRGEVISNPPNRSEQPASDGSISFRA
ncbi:flagellar hook-length control protein FliK [Planctomicrobium piriforme]|uniref:Hook-length control protein FliK n=1 Tax=Planctomicrobium piriforme TaxID=1576369 RepID=A0A1I3HMM6_9PLAN|nr:flagellar hook-length control protein FliK [Planctomicrobium piriforme]SFI37028.1 hook-length control protein FliK [Planctomicrobium piriforme]